MRVKILKIMRWAAGVMLVALFIYCAAFLRAGETRIIQSNVLDETRSVTVYLPRGYDGDEKSYPVIYSLDGEKWRYGAIVAANARFLSTVGLTDPVIVVAVHTEGHRVRDYIPTNKAVKFLSFLKAEVIPWVESRYKAGPDKILSGHSLGGLFTLFALAHEPALFQAYFAYDPSILRDDRLLSKLAEMIESGNVNGKYVYVNYGFHSQAYRRRMIDLWSTIQHDKRQLLSATKTFYPLPHSLIMLPGQLEALSSAR